MNTTTNDLQTQPSKSIETFFASPERITGTNLTQSALAASEDSIIQVVLKSLGGFVMILNEHRQVLAASPELMEALDINEPGQAIGFRPGELLECVHNSNAPAGCGTSEACQHCGAVLAILGSQQSGEVMSGECSLTMQGEHGIECVEFRVHVTPLTIGNNKLQIFVLQDISAEKRRDILERVFFHDLRNTLGGLLGLGQILQQSNNPEEIASKIVTLSQRLAQEINNQQVLIMAERGEITIELDFIRVCDVMNSITNIFEKHETSLNKTLDIQMVDDHTLAYTDVTLLTRILVNMVKNALEASNPGEIVKLWFEHKNGRPVFHVHNPAFMPGEVALRVFQRSFSTKASSGRGLGTYSMKLFGETYLKGNVDFETSEEHGTTFSISLPLMIT